MGINVNRDVKLGFSGVNLGFDNVIGTRFKSGRSPIKRVKPVASILTLVLLLIGNFALADGPNCGFLWNDSHLTLDTGHKLEVLGPLFYEQQKGPENTWA